jgi:uncharacterized protein YceK
MKRIALLLLAVLLTGCSLIPSGATPTPPALTVTAGNQIIPVKLGSYCWKSGTRAVCADGPGPREIFRGEAPPVVTGAQTLQLKFATPPKSWSALRITATQELPVPAGPGDVLPLPTEPGTYIYSVTGQWPGHGDGYYLFQVAVP